MRREPSPFQRRLMAVCQEILSVLGPDFAPFKAQGEDETYFLTTITTFGHQLQIYVYQDEAEFILDGGEQNRHFEKWDYASEDHLIDAFGLAVREVLSSWQPRTE